MGLRSRPLAFQCSTAARVSSTSTWPIHLLDRAEAELRHVLAHLLGDVLDEVLDELGLAGELLAQLGVLGGDADRAGVQVADAHHDAAADHERGGGEAELLGAEQRGDDDVAAGLELAVGLHHDPVAQAVEHSVCWVSARPSSHGPPACLSDVSGEAPVPPSWPEMSTTSACALADARRDRADADLGDELDVDAGLGLAFFRSWMSCARSSIE
jgi:hypothetical protein